MSLKAETENVISSGVDEVNRRIFFGRYLPNTVPDDGTTFDAISIEYAIRAIHKMLDVSTKKPIEIHMNSVGGDPYSMLYLLDVILSSPTQFKFFGGGAIMSAATWIMAASDERYLYKNTTVMIHKGSFGPTGNVTDVQIAVDEDKRLTEILENIYAHNSHMPKSFWSEVCKRDLYLTAEEAVTLGLADKVIEHKKRGSLRKMRQSHMLKRPSPGTLKKLVARLYDRIQYPVGLKDINLNEPIKEEIDETLVIDTNKGDLNGTDTGTTRATESGTTGSGDGSSGK